MVDTLEPRQLLAAACWQVQVDPTLHLALSSTDYPGTLAIIPASTSTVTRVSNTTALVAADTWQDAVKAATTANAGWQNYLSTANPERFKAGLASEIGAGSLEGSLSEVLVSWHDFTGIDANQKVIGFEDGDDWDYNDAYFAVTVTQVPGGLIAPTNLTLSVTNGTQTQLQWQDNAFNETAYQVERSTDQVTWNVVATTTANVTRFVDPVVGHYSYRVVARNATAVSMPSNVVHSPSIGLRGTYFSNIDFTGATVTRTDTQVNFQWLDGSPATGIGADRFSVRWEGSVQAPAAGDYTFRVTGDDGVRLFVDGDLVTPPWGWCDHPDASYDSVPITFAAGQQRQIRMEMYENCGNAMARLEWKRPGQGDYEVVSASQLYKPEADWLLPPSNLTASVVSGSQVQLLWQNNTSGETGFVVERATDAGFTQNLVTQSLPANTTAYDDTDLVAGATYYYRVKVIGSGQTQVSSSSVSVTPTYMRGQEVEYLVNLPVSVTNYNGWQQSVRTQGSFSIVGQQDAYLTQWSDDWYGLKVSVSKNGTNYPATLEFSQASVFPAEPFHNSGMSYPVSSTAPHPFEPNYHDPSFGEYTVSAVLRFTPADAGDYAINASAFGAFARNYWIQVNPSWNGHETEETFGLFGDQTWTFHVGSSKANPDNVTAEAGKTTTLNVLGNDLSSAGSTQPLTICGFTAPSHGRLVKNADQTFSYTPSASFSGSDSFSYTIQDADGATDTANVLITVCPSKDRYPDPQDDGYYEGQPISYAITIPVTTTMVDNRLPGHVYPSLAYIISSSFLVEVLKDGNPYPSTLVSPANGQWTIVTENGQQVVKATVRFTPDDNGTYSVKGYVDHREALAGLALQKHVSGDAQVSLVVKNAPPTATLTVTQGDGTVSVSLGGGSDPSTADTAAGFLYSFDYDDGDFANDNGAVIDQTNPNAPNPPDWATQVWGRIKDKDGGCTTYGPRPLHRVPKAPSDPQAEAPNPYEMNLSWKDNSAIETGYSIELSSDGGKSWELSGTADVNACHYTVKGLSSETDYQFRIMAVGSGGNSEAVGVDKSTPADTGTVEADLGDKQPSISSETVVSWSNCEPGRYRVRYVGGTMSYWRTGDRWMVNDWNDGVGFMIIYGTGDRALAPGTAVEYPNADDAQTASLNQVTYFYHLDNSDIKIYLHDSPCDDNRAGSNGSPKFKLERMTPVPTVSISVDNNSPIGAPRFTFTRTGDTSHSLTVKYFVAGTAIPGTDYTSPSASNYSQVVSLTIDAGKTSATVTVVPASVAENTPYVRETQSDKSLSIGLVADASYRLSQRTGQTSIASVAHLSDIPASPSDDDTAWGSLDPAAYANKMMTIATVGGVPVQTVLVCGENEGGTHTLDGTAVLSSVRVGSDGKRYVVSSSAATALLGAVVVMNGMQGTDTYGTTALGNYIYNTGDALAWNGDEILAKSTAMQQQYNQELNAIRSYVASLGSNAAGTYHRRAWEAGEISQSDNPSLYFAFRGYNYLSRFAVSEATTGGYRVDVQWIISKRYNFDQGESFNGVSADWLWALHGLGDCQNFFISATATTSFVVGGN